MNTEDQNKQREQIAALAGKINEAILEQGAEYTFTEVFNALAQNVVLVTLDHMNATGKLSTVENFAEAFNRFIALVGRQAEFAIKQEQALAQLASVAQSGLILPEQGVVTPSSGIILTS